MRVGVPLAAPLAVRAQTPGRVSRIADVSGGAAGPQPVAFAPALRDSPSRTTTYYPCSDCCLLSR